MAVQLPKSSVRPHTPRPLVRSEGCKANNAVEYTEDIDSSYFKISGDASDTAAVKNWLWKFQMRGSPLTGGEWEGKLMFVECSEEATQGPVKVLYGVSRSSVTLAGTESDGYREGFEFGGDHQGAHDMSKEKRKKKGGGWLMRGVTARENHCRYGGAQ